MTVLLPLMVGAALERLTSPAAPGAEALCSRPSRPEPTLGPVAQPG